MSSRPVAHRIEDFVRGLGTARRKKCCRPPSRCKPASDYSLNATPLNAETPAALDVATWVNPP